MKVHCWLVLIALVFAVSCAGSKPPYGIPTEWESAQHFVSMIGDSIKSGVRIDVSKIEKQKYADFVEFMQNENAAVAYVLGLFIDKGVVRTTDEAIRALNALENFRSHDDQRSAEDKLKTLVDLPRSTASGDQTTETGQECVLLYGVTKDGLFYIHPTVDEILFDKRPFIRSALIDAWERDARMEKDQRSGYYYYQLDMTNKRPLSDGETIEYCFRIGDAEFIPDRLVKSHSMKYCRSDTVGNGQRSWNFNTHPVLRTPFAVDVRPAQFPFDLETQFFPSGWMGDGKYGEKYLSVTNVTASIEGQTWVASRFDYQPGPEGWAGIYWLYPDKNWGQSEGKNLSGARRIAFYARSDQSGEIVEFKSGGVSGEKHEDTFEVSIGKTSLSTQWTKYSIDLTKADLANVIGAFAWVASVNNSEQKIVFYIANLVIE